MNRIYILMTSFLFGLGSSFFIDTPFGRAAMFDLVCYVLGPSLFVSNYKKFTKTERRILMFSVLWFLGAVYSNWWRDEPFDVAVKGNAIVFNVWCMIVVGIWLLKKDYRTWLWFTVGNGISCVISLYYFQNGALLYFAENAGFGGEGGLQSFLIEKQVYPLYLKAVIFSILLPMVVFFHLPWAPVIAAIIGFSVFLLFRGGSRSSFGVNIMTSFFFIGYAYMKRLMRGFLDNAILLGLIAMFLGIFIFAIYKNLAVSGALGEAEYVKYQREMVDSEAGLLGSRDDIIRAWPFLKRHPIVGAGSSSFDRWGYMADDPLLPGHSALVGSWVQNGFLGLVFWVYALWVIARFVQKKVLRFGDYAPFMVMRAVSMVWAILFSPFGGYRGEVSVLLALCVVAQDEKWLCHVEMMLSKRRRSGHNGQLLRQR